MDASQIITSLNALGVGDIDNIRRRLDEARDACAELGQNELAERLVNAREALESADTKTYRKNLETVISKLGHVR